MIYVLENQGMRPYMEDRNYVELRFHYDYDLFCIFDGHGNDEVAKFLRLYFKDILRNEMVQEDDVSIALKNAFIKMNDIIPKHMGMTSGSTGLVMVRKNRELWVANAGDCRVIMNNNANAVEISIDHKPNLKSEYDRITKLGGAVIMDPMGTPRVNGTLAVSRSFGDFYLKPYVTAEPDIYHLMLNDTNKLIFAASDGIWDVIKNQEVIDIFKEENKANNNNMKEYLRSASTKILNIARQRMSGDNVTIMVIFNP